MPFKKNRLSADLNKAVIPKHFLFKFTNTKGYLGMKDLPDRLNVPIKEGETF